MRWACIALATGCSFSPNMATTTSGDGAAGSDNQVVMPDAPDGSGSGSGDIPSSARCASDATYIARPGSNHTYKRLAGNKTFDDAVDACYREGGYLVTVDDASENQFLNTTFSGENWLGASDQEIEGTFVTVQTRQPIPYNRFGGGEPNDNFRQEDCAKLNSDGSWNDVQCGEQHSAICECDPQFTPHTPPACRTTTGAITVQSRMYFKFEAQGASWQDAHAACAAMGATLIEVSDDTENGWIQSNTNLHFDTDLWLGLHQAAATWSWDDGTPYGYEKWDGADPVTTDQCALQHQSNSAWVASDCTATHSYGCECVP